MATRSDGAADLRGLLDDPQVWQRLAQTSASPSAAAAPEASMQADHEAVHGILQRQGLDVLVPHTASDRIDAVVLHPVAGPLLLAAVLFLVFQAVFAWAQAPMELIKAATGFVGETVTALLPDSWLRSLSVTMA